MITPKINTSSNARSTQASLLLKIVSVVLSLSMCFSFAFGNVMAERAYAAGIESEEAAVDDEPLAVDAESPDIEDAADDDGTIDGLDDADAADAEMSAYTNDQSDPSDPNDPVDPSDPTPSGPTRIHVLNVVSADAIVLESDGKFGIVDSGEDNDYPSGNDPKYPFRSGTTVGSGTEAQVIAYLQSLGVDSTNLEFYIGTHPHSDHIGSADEVIRAFCPKRVYITEYKDEYITNPDGLWDNLYVYDNMLEAAEEVGALVIQSLDPSAADVESGLPVFDLGEMQIEIVNYDEGYKSTLANDANDFSWGVKVTAMGHTAFLAGDINNYDGDETRLASELGQVDFLKLGHHGYAGSNTSGYLEALSPKVATWTGWTEYIPSGTIKTLERLKTAFAPACESVDKGYQSVIATFGASGISVNTFDGRLSYTTKSFSPRMSAYVDGYKANAQTGWVKYYSDWYYFTGGPDAIENQWLPEGGYWYLLKDDARMAVGWAKKDGAWYYFDGSGHMLSNQWIDYGGSWYYLTASGYAHMGWLNSGGWYYMDPAQDGAMRTGWFAEPNGTWYYANGSGQMQTGWINLGKWYLLSGSGALQTGWVNQGGTWYYLDPAAGGEMRTGWFLDDTNTWYYAANSGAMQTGWLHDGAWYLLAGSGAMMTGWVNLGGTWYYMDVASGAMCTNWYKDNTDTWYYSYSSGAMASSQWIGGGSSWYYVTSSGAMMQGWLYDGGHWYYLDPAMDGLMRTGTFVDNQGRTYTCDGSGAWVG